MISEPPIVEFILCKHPDETCTGYVTGLNGRVHWELFEQFKQEMTDDAFTSHPDIKPILKQYDHEQDGIITIIAEFSEVDTEVQFGVTGELNVMTGYYDIRNCRVVSFERMTDALQQIKEPG